ncbi:hypothetical protein RN001_000019 [Aquatica leii]|uniref:Uncharacterized protein n=1 Tax=Aquatica leii TaxID=1421715 RepID=A0AAN7PES7_9COLE|nr:hypothetical protein RN001_000019 [Aquatica leii]
MHSNIFYCVLLIGFQQVFSLEFPDELYDKHSLECMKKVNVDKAFVNKVMDEDFHISKITPKLNEFMECVAASKNALNEAGKMNRDILYNDVLNGLLPLMNKTKDQVEIANKVTDECIDVIHEHTENRFMHLHNCLVDAANKH